jgi:hypothetical protein
MNSSARRSRNSESFDFNACALVEPADGPRTSTKTGRASPWTFRPERRASPGGALYDALVGATAREAGATLTLDRRAVTTYQLLRVDHRLIG